MHAAAPLHRQIYEAWRGGILAGRFRHGDRVPSTRELASTLGVSRSTVTEAYDQLIAEGYLESAHGAGTFVCRELPDQWLRPHGSPANGSAPGAPVACRASARGLRMNRGIRSRRPFLPASSIYRMHGPLSTSSRFRSGAGCWPGTFEQTTPALFDYAAQAGGNERLRQSPPMWPAPARCAATRNR